MNRGFLLYDRFHARFLKPRFRRARMRMFLEHLRPTATTRILDVGGEPDIWRFIDCRSPITMLNLSVPQHPPADLPNITYVQGNGTALAFEDQSFDIVFSNSVIEHLETLDQQRKFASEVRRVGKHYWVQTPNYWFPIEPHVVSPMVHWLPKSARPLPLRYASLWGLMSKPKRAEIENFQREVRLLRRSELVDLFPGDRILCERLAGIPKSFVVLRGTGREG